MKVTGREPKFDEITLSMDLGVSQKLTLESALRFQSITSLDQEIGDGGNSLRDLIADTSPSQEEMLMAQSDADELERALHTLDDREREILSLRTGVNGEKEFTLDEIGRRFGLTRERIRQIAAKAVKKVLTAIELNARTEEELAIDTPHVVDVTPKVLQAVADAYNVRVDDIRSASRRQSFVFCRHLALYLLHLDFNFSSLKLGKVFNRDHSSVLHAYKKMKWLIEHDKELFAKVTDIRMRYLNT
jgi:RNA polymerase sigma factor (sigma-70 family)